jgi:hypothetical protein
MNARLCQVRSMQERILAAHPNTSGPERCGEPRQD